MTRIHHPTLLVIGNIATGKSTVSRIVQAAYPNIVYACLDRLRVEQEYYSVHTNQFDRDRASAKELERLILQDKPVLYESTAATMVFNKMYRSIIVHRKGPVKVIRTTCTFTTAMARFRRRRAEGHIQYKPAVRNRDSIEDCFWRFEEGIKTRPHLLIDTEAVQPQDMKALVLDFVKPLFG